MWTFLLSNLLNPFASVAKNVWTYFVKNPAARGILFAALLTGSLVFGVKQCHRANENETALATANVQNDSLKLENNALLRTQNNATNIKQTRNENTTKILAADSVKVAAQSNAVLRSQRDSIIAANRLYIRTRTKRRD